MVLNYGLPAVIYLLTGHGIAARLDRARQWTGLFIDRHESGPTMTHSSAGNDRLPIYEDLIRERGDVVAEAQRAAEHTQHQAAELLTGRDAGQQARRWDGSTGAAAAGQPQWRGSPR